MRNTAALVPLFLLIILPVSSALDIMIYYGQGCPHCVTTEATLTALAPDYGLNITKKEVFYDTANRAEMLELYRKYGVDPSSGKSGVPTTLVGGKALAIGEMPEAKWRDLLGNCSRGMCEKGVYTENSFSKIEEKDETSQLTFAVLVGAAAVDSINPCTIAIMVMLISTMLLSRGRGEALIAGLLFSLTIFVMYLLMGFGIFQVISDTRLQTAFLALVTLGAGALAFLEIRAWFYYEPGMASVEMPLFLRPYAKDVISRAASYPGVVVAALFCSLFLLPCSSGPYLMVLGMLAKAATLQALSYLVLYNLIFVLPMVLITVAIYVGKTTAEKMDDLKETYIREIHLVSGVILLILFILMLRDLLISLHIV